MKSDELSELASFSFFILFSTSQSPFRFIRKPFHTHVHCQLCIVDLSSYLQHGSPSSIVVSPSIPFRSSPIRCLFVQSPQKPSIPLST